MKGLLIKDVLLLRSQARSLVILLFCGIVMSLTLQPSAAVMYIMLMGTMLATGTLSYDEMGNGYTYLLSLPVTRKGFVREKYLFSLSCLFLCFILGTAVSLIISLTQKAGENGNSLDSLLSMAAGTFIAMAVFLSTMIPLRIRYGAEKGRIVQYIMFGGILIIGALVTGVGKQLQPSAAADLLARLKSVNASVIGAAAAAGGIVILAVSEQISEKIMEKKEF